jgi:N-methylhydantoinase B
LSAVSFPYNVRDVSIEWSEHETPILYHARELIPDSGGPGKSRGGLGQELIFEAYEPGTAPKQPLVFSGAAGRMRFPPQGLGGGKPGALARIAVDDKPIAPSSSPEFPFKIGEVVHLQLPGGGGHGDPLERDRDEIARDLKAGYISPEGAKRDYGAG